MGKHSMERTVFEGVKIWLEWLFQYEHRRVLYGLVTLFGPLAVTYGLLAEQDYAVVLGFVGAFAGNAVASWNTPAGGRMLPDGGVRVPRPDTVEPVFEPVLVEPVTVSDNSEGDHVVVIDGEDNGVVG